MICGGHKGPKRPKSKIDLVLKQNLSRILFLFLFLPLWTEEIFFFLPRFIASGVVVMLGGRHAELKRATVNSAVSRSGVGNAGSSLSTWRSIDLTVRKPRRLLSKLMTRNWQAKQGDQFWDIK